jgi:hypothetical protein
MLAANRKIFHCLALHFADIVSREFAKQAPLG